MGRHAADRPAPGTDGSTGRHLVHADLIAPAPGTAAAAAREARAAAAFDALVEPHRDALYAYVLRLTDGDETAAASVFKEALYRAAQDPSRFPQRASAVRPWLVLTARAVLRDGARLAPAGHDDRPPPVSHRERTPAPAPQPTTVMRAIDELSGTHRDILVELFYRGVSLEDAAAARGVPVETVKSRLYFAMRAMRIVLDQQVADRHGGT